MDPNHTNPEPDPESLYILGLAVHAQSHGCPFADPWLESVHERLLCADTSVKLAAEAELVKAFAYDPYRLLYVLVDLGDRCLGKICCEFRNSL